MWPTFYIPQRVRPRVSSRFYLTTPPYTVEVREEMQSSGVTFGGYQSTLDIEKAQASASFISGVLVTRLLSQVQPEDEAKSSAAFISGVLVTRLISQVQPEDEAQCSAAFIGGTLQRILISYTRWPLLVADESLGSSTAFLSGELA